MTTSVGTSTNRRNLFLQLGLHHLNPPYLDSKLTSKGNIGKNTKCSKGTKGCRLKYMKAMSTMDYSFVALPFLLLQCIQGVPYIELQRGNGGRILAFSRHLEGQESIYSDSNEKNSKKIKLHTSLCTRV